MSSSASCGDGSCAALEEKAMYEVDCAFGRIRDTVPLAEREGRWGFTLEELVSASKVVRTLFHDPSLFVSDPFLTESRLYTMITRDRRTKREFKDAFKQILAEEKRRRKRQQTATDSERLQKTTMKRERDEVGALRRVTSTMMLDDVEDDDVAPVRQLLRKDTATRGELSEFLENIDDDVVGDAKGAEDETDAEHQKTFAGECDPGVATGGEAPAGLSQGEREMYSLIGGFENLVRLEVEHSAPEVDWISVTQLNAQVYRYLPHEFGSQMPPPLFPGPVPPDTPGPVRQSYLRGLKAHIAQRVATMVAADSDLFTCERKCIRELKSVAGVLQNPSTLPPRAVLVPRLLEHLSAAVLDGVVSEELQRAYEDAADSFGIPIMEAVVSSLDVYIARRLYSDAKYRDEEESPRIVDVRAPSADTDIPESLASPFLRAQRWHGWDEDHPLAFGLATHTARKCYICCSRFCMIHPYYYSLCTVCGEFNYNKRLMARDLRGKVVLLTGCRIKIGFAMALSLLRCGATLIGTTRFAHEALARFAAEPDYERWSDRLAIYSLDLRDLWVVTQFCGFLVKHYPKIFAIVNNAAQTIARTPAYTAHLRAIERDPPPALRDALNRDEKMQEWHQFFTLHTSVTIGQPLKIECNPQAEPFKECEADAGTAAPQLTASANATPSSGTAQPDAGSVDGVPQSRAVDLATSVVTSRHDLVFDRYDMLSEMCDMREKNSWTMNMDEVAGSEAAEVMAINALAPFILNSRLKPCLLNRAGDAVPNENRFIINVSAMEGKFYRFKQTTHPHTNMAKAALNMMTRTSAKDYAQGGIYMSAVDTGWITDEIPQAKQELLRKTGKETTRSCPLDEVDAAARCLDLIYTNRTSSGKFWKDFSVTMW